MAATTTRLLDQTTVSEGDTITALDAPDYGDHQTVEVVVTVHEAGDGEAPVLCIQHAPVQEDGAWMDFPTPIKVSLLRAGRTWVHVPCFTRYIGWSVLGTLSASASVTVDLVGKG